MTTPYRMWGSSEDKTVEFESLTKNTFEGALEVIRKSFFVYENVCRGVNLLSEPGASEELEELCLETAKDGVSIVALNVSNGEVIGVAFNKIQVLTRPSEKSAFEIFSENCKYKSSKALVNFIINMDARVNLFKHYNTDCIFEIMFLATLPKYQKRRIGELLVSTSIKIANELKDGNNVKIPITINDNSLIRNLRALPNLVTALMTSNYSQKIAAKCGFENLVTVSFEEFEFNGKTFSERIGDEHEHCVLVAKKLLD
ncbi:hypothetical protein E2986_03237 [Frieseomelitta varia]|uniref:N-acetyltransferase domain-containing protein n=1 Tax=Frieseomelitta varia TaxID=561572 RepID=A0A833W2W9_9HYME|nr:uncharacterized protein LOC122535732 [Frieseomelitta varia]XP_043523450.1 uncharacterized protein LOC122535732 [Frieseomelitta varia]KAF3422172.1 hypothetical protein E2986_03237 [Frieseomelitta varia]